MYAQYGKCCLTRSNQSVYIWHMGDGNSSVWYVNCLTDTKHQCRLQVRNHYGTNLFIIVREDEKQHKLVNARLPSGRLPEAICIICPKRLYLLPEGIVSFARSILCRLPEARKSVSFARSILCRLPEEICITCPIEFTDRAEYCQIVIFKDTFLL